MKKRISFLLVAALLLATLIPALPVLADDGETVANTFNANDANPTISTAADYIAFFNAAYNQKNSFAGKTVTMLNDITLNDTTAADWYTNADAVKLTGTNDGWGWFQGTFDGGNHTLKGAIPAGVYRSDVSFGIFPYVGNGGAIKNLIVDGFYVCSTNTSVDWSYGKAGIGGLIGFAKGDVTVDNCTLKNGIVTSVKNGLGNIGALIGTYFASNGSATRTLRITDTTASDVQVDKGESLCSYAGGIMGILVAESGVSNPTLDFSGSVIQPVGSLDGTDPLKPVGVWANQGQTVKWAILNRAVGDATISDNWVWLNDGEKTNYPGGGEFGKNPDSYCDGQIIKSRCYGANAAPTVKLVGAQESTTHNGIRFVGLVAKSVIDDGTLAALGFRLTVGEKTVEADTAACTKVYTSILEDGKTLEAPEGYYYFTFVVTDVTAGTAFAVTAVATVGEKVCTTSQGSYTYTPAAD